MSTQYWRSVSFKDQEVWAECDAEGTLLPLKGRVRIAYREGANKAYATFEDRLKVVDGSPLSEFTIPIDGPPGGGREGSGSGKANSSIFGGKAADLEDPAHIHLWSDGACSGNPGPAGAGTVLLLGGNRIEWSTWLGEGTNNTAELTAVLQGLDALPAPVERTVVVHTDSQYVIGVCAKGWKAKANQDLVRELKASVERCPRVVWHWVRGHLGVELNERCDELAREAIVRRASDRRERSN